MGAWESAGAWMWMVDWCIVGGPLWVGRVGFSASFFFRMPRHLRIEMMTPISGPGCAAGQGRFGVFECVCF